MGDIAAIIYNLFLLAIYLIAVGVIVFLFFAAVLPFLPAVVIFWSCV